ncbi:Sua5/YciO/YrdC/YwlC family protein, partial [Neisseria sp. SLRRB23]|uniref:Sua5/YciO/YrdC/YwlC family protein n=1 Tax=Neisseria sp. SLRRB23 TaxID=3435199 RepID=UPI003D7FF3D3
MRCTAQRKLSVYLKKGGLVAYPTESCYGLGCLPTLAKALGKLAHLKKRLKVRRMPPALEALGSLVRPRRELSKSNQYFVTIHILTAVSYTHL